MKIRPSTKRFFEIVIVSLVLTVFLSSCSVSDNPVQADQSLKTTISVEVTKSNETAMPVSTSTPAPCTDTEGAISEINIPSEVLGEEIHARVYLPPCYASQKAFQYSVLYMLHGQTSLDDQWVRLGLFLKMDELLSQKEVNPFIIVLPNEERSNIESYQSTYGEALVEDMIPYINEHYRVCTEKECRAIGGLSRGGNWAVHLGFEHPELFAAVGAHSAPLFYGEISSIYILTSSPALPNAWPVFYVDVGNKDLDHADVKDFVEMLDDLNLQYQYNDFLGYHDEAYWSSHVIDYLEWYSSQLKPPSLIKK